MVVVISLGGSVINGTGVPDTDFISGFSDVVKRVLRIKNGHERLVIVTGGGRTNRLYNEAMNRFNVPQVDCHQIGTMFTHVNAFFVLSILRAQGLNVCPELFTSTDFALKTRDALKFYDVVVTGGTVPGITTDTDSAILAVATNAKRLINITNVDGVYDSDPRKNPKAKKFSRMTHSELLKLVLNSTTGRPGENIIFDLHATKLAVENNIELHFVKGHNFSDVENAILGKRHNGTVVKD